MCGFRTSTNVTIRGSSGSATALILPGGAPTTSALRLPAAEGSAGGKDGGSDDAGEEAEWALAVVSGGA